jgi:FKBP-type peptidyl-prolyl cis-trans isomerase SlyD
MSGTTVVDGVVVLVHYTLKNDEGEVLDSSADGDPLPYLHGASNIVSGLENALAGKVLGEQLVVRVPPEEGYGEHDPERVSSVPSSAFPEDAELEVGAQFVMQTDDGQPVPVWVTGISDEEVTLDANHPLAGIALNFSVEISAIRPATDEEKAHGHPHGLTGTEGHH